MLSPRDQIIDLHGTKRYTNLIEKENQQTKMSNPPTIVNCIDFVKQSQ
jgi:dissimilatory sulfite reductase (desulfoviridin) alpha/beta subunit